MPGLRTRISRVSNYITRIYASWVLRMSTSTLMKTVKRCGVKVDRRIS